MVMKSMCNMNAERVVEILLNPGLIEATVRLPPRSGIWVAVYTGSEPGKQIWRTTGLTDREAALTLARKWETEARRQRAASSVLSRKPTIRVRYGSGEAAIGLLTQKEVAAVLGLSVRAIREIERRAFEKLRRHPALRQFWREHVIGDVEENVRSHDFSRPEVAALFGLVRTRLERRALHKVLGTILTDRLLRS
jgi:hypothetical protein